MISIYQFCCGKIHLGLIKPTRSGEIPRFVDDFPIFPRWIPVQKSAFAEILMSQEGHDVTFAESHFVGLTKRGWCTALALMSCLQRARWGAGEVEIPPLFVDGHMKYMKFGIPFLGSHGFLLFLRFWLSEFGYVLSLSFTLWMALRYQNQDFGWCFVRIRTFPFLCCPNDTHLDGP